MLQWTQGEIHPGQPGSSEEALRSQVCCTDYWQQSSVHFWGRLVESVVFEKTVIESTFDYWIEAEYEYWIVHFMNGLLNQQTKSFAINEFISSLAPGTFDLLWLKLKKGKGANKPRAQTAGTYTGFRSMKHAQEYSYSPLIILMALESSYKIPALLLKFFQQKFWMMWYQMKDFGMVSIHCCWHHKLLGLHFAYHSGLIEIYQIQKFAH